MRLSVLVLLPFIGIAYANEATMSGRIGFSADQLSDMDWYTPRTSKGGCRWYGTSPFCNGQCPDGYQQIRESNGRNSNWWISGFNIPDDSFGRACTTILGGFFKKRYCCSADPSDCSWTGVWQKTSKPAIYYCRYDGNDGTRCGSLECNINTWEERGTYRIEISGDRCDYVNMFGVLGKATCGYIEWYEKGENDDGSRSPTDSWYKLK